ncbi:hypothetical protein VaNZ11_008735 [Volvox africanus]|uniref:Photolyase/cryptochrome alpha/beta domain-containing protein n=1 Tax=Volvox africanus TaxID=51714 RepID=A0ABQ5S733_9CHLO|nr:hypothetical protein VaNZ11_008735 [Volvox africanus]
MDTQCGGGPLPIAALSLHALGSNSLILQRPARPTKVTGPFPVTAIRDGLRSHPIDAMLADDVANSERARQHSARTQSHQQHTLARLLVAIPGALGRFMSLPSSQSPFTGINRLSDMRVFPSVMPKRAARGGGSLPGGGAGRKAAVMWFRNDLRLHDNPSLDRACREGTSVLPVYVFDPRDYGKAPNGFGRTGPARAQFILDAVSDLRARLRADGSDLLVRVGRPEEVVPELAAAVGAGAVYCQAEVTEEAMQVEGRLKAALDRDGCELRAEWGGTLYHVDDLPFQLSAMPTNYADFRSQVAGLSVRPLVASERGIKGLPQANSLEAGELPSLHQLGVSAPSPAHPAAVGGGFGAPPLTAAMQALRGGETEALKHLQAFMLELKATISAKSQSARQSQRQQRGGPAATATATPSSNPASSSFSCRISPWLALGCLSPRRMFLEMKQQLGGQEPPKVPPKPSQQQQQPRQLAAAAANGPANWLVFELLWRDFFRFVSQKYTASASRPGTTSAASAASVMTATGAPRVARSVAVTPSPAHALSVA